MKKLLLGLIVALSISVTITSCTEEEVKPLESSTSNGGGGGGASEPIQP